VIYKQLSKKETDVFILVGQGLTAKEIADKLGKTTNTVDEQRRSIMRKLKIWSKDMLIHVATKKLCNAC